MQGSILNILCRKLPGFLTQPMFNEYENRRSQIAEIYQRGYKTYIPLKEYAHVIDSLLALCIFYRYVIGNMTGASGFFSFLNKQNGRKKDCEIRCGDFRLNREQYNKILSVSFEFELIREKYQLGDWFFEFSDVPGFLQNCKKLLDMPEYMTDNNLTNHEEDYPF